MLIKTDNCTEVRRARITLECDLPVQYYSAAMDGSNLLKLRLGKVAKDLEPIERSVVNASGSVTMTLSTVVPVGYQPLNEWLAIELTDTGLEHVLPSDWEDFVVRAAAKIVSRLATGRDDRIAKVDIGSSRFVIMDDTTDGEVTSKGSVI